MTSKRPAPAADDAAACGQPQGPRLAPPTSTVTAPNDQAENIYEHCARARRVLRLEVGAADESARLHRDHGAARLLALGHVLDVFRVERPRPGRRRRHERPVGSRQSVHPLEDFV